MARLLSRQSGPGSVASMSCLGLAVSACTGRCVSNKIATDGRLGGIQGVRACQRGACGVARLLSRHSGPGSMASMICLGLMSSARTGRWVSNRSCY